MEDEIVTIIAGEVESGKKSRFKEERFMAAGGKGLFFSVFHLSG